jgi:hypothetical protein
MPPAETSSRIPDPRLPELLALIEQADSVELKLTVAESDQHSAVEALGMDPLDAHIRQVYFFDTPDLALDRAGVVVRARRVQRKQDDVVVKLRPVVPAELARRTRRTPGFGVEVDAMPGGFVCSARFKASVPPGKVKDATSGRRPLRKLFTDEQRAFFKAHAPAGVSLDDLAVLGPIFVLKLKFSPEGFDGKLAAEMWMYPDDSRILELSTRCAPADAFQVAAEARGFLAGCGVDVSGEQQTKTRRALEFFSARHTAA